MSQFMPQGIEVVNRCGTAAPADQVLARLLEVFTKAAADAADAGKAGKKGKSPGPNGKAGAAVEKKPPSAELVYSRSLRADPHIRIGGATDDGQIDTTFFRWVGSHWKGEINARMEAQALAWAEKHADDKARAAWAKSAVETSVLALLEDDKHSLPKTEKTIIPIQGTWLHIEADGTIYARDPDPSIGVTYTLNVALDPAAIAPDGRYQPQPIPKDCLWAQYLDLFHPTADLREMLQEALAASLLPYTLELCFWLRGSGGNGKSTVLHILRTLHQHTMAINLDKIDERHELETLPGVTLAIASETPAKKFNEDRLKALISRDPISINPKGKTIRTIVPRCTFYLAMNRDLTVTDYTEGFWRKVAVIPFNEAITAQNKINGFDKKITGSPEEMRRVLDWLLEGAIRIVKRGGRFCELPAASIEMMRDQRAKSDAVLGWMYDCEVKPCTGYADKGAIYQGFHEWCLREGRQPQGAPQFWTRLEAHFRREHKCGVNEKHASFMGVRVRRVAITGAGIKMTEAPLPPPPPRSETLVVSSAPSDCPF